MKSNGKAYQENRGFEFSTRWFGIEVVVRVAVEGRGTVLDPGVAYGVDWLKRHDAMQDRTSRCPYRELARRIRNKEGRVVADTRRREMAELSEVFN